MVESKATCTMAAVQIRLEHRHRAGLVNSGNTCYSNAAIQLLLTAKPIISRYSDEESVIVKDVRKESRDKLFFSEGYFYRKVSFNAKMVELVRDITMERDSDVSAENLKMIASHRHPTFSSKNQQDSLEFFLHLISTIEDNVPSQHKDKMKPCDCLRVDLSEQIIRGNITKIVHRHEYVISCPLAEPHKDTTRRNQADCADAPSLIDPSNMDLDDNSKNKFNTTTSPGNELILPSDKNAEAATSNHDETSVKTCAQPGNGSSVHSAEALTETNTGITKEAADEDDTQNFKYQDDCGNWVCVSRSEQLEINSAINKNTPREPSNMHGWEKKKYFNLVDCIDKFMMEEKIITKGDEPVTKQTRIAVPSEYIVIQPRIFEMNQWGQPDKIRNVHLDVPDILDIKKWISDYEQRQPTTGMNTTYELKAFVTHQGFTPYCGHYICHVKYKNTWYEYDDSRVRCVQETHKEHGYFYLYERQETPREHQTQDDN